MSDQHDLNKDRLLPAPLSVQSGPHDLYMESPRYDELLLAAISGDIEAVRRLIPLVRDIDAPSHNQIALHHAALNGRLEIVKMLLDAGAHIDRYDMDGTTPLMCACMGNDPETVFLLMRRRANLALVDSFGRSAMFYAATHEGALVVRALAHAGLGINDRDAAGQTPLMAAAEHNELQCVSTLIELGADVHATDNTGRSALDHAVASGAEEAAYLLRSHLPASQSAA